MKFILATILLATLCKVTDAQTLDSIFFNLYTDSLKKGTYNYINVVGHFTDSTYLPLSSKELKFSSSAGKFSGNSLFLDTSFKDEKVKVSVSLIKNPRMTRETDIYIKKYEETERLPTMDEVMGKPSNGNSDTKKKKKRR